MELFLQYGFGMKEHCKTLLANWGNGTVILSPRDIEPTKLPIYSKEFSKVKGKILFDPQLYYPRANHPRLTGHEYWPDNYSTDILSDGSALKRLIRDIKQVNNVVNSNVYILPGIYCSRVNKDWLAVHDNIINIAASIMSDKKRYASLCICSESLRFEEQLELILSRSEGWDVDGYYIIPEHPNGQYLVDDPIWLANLLTFCAGLKLQGRKVIVGYSSHQMLSLAAASVDAIASGTWLNLRRLTSSKYNRAEESSVSRRAKWFYCPHTLSEYKIQFLDVAFKANILDQMAPDSSLSSIFGSMLFSGAQPSTTNYGEGNSFRHYLHCLHEQCRYSVRSTHKDTVNALELQLETAEIFIKKFRKHGVRGQDRDFYEILDVNRAALAILNQKRGFVLDREWSRLIK